MSKEIVWCAGFFDGEGCISLQLLQERYWAAHVQLVQRDPIPLAIFEKLFGGARSITGPKRDAILLSFRKAEAQHLISTLLPHLIVKRTQAELLVEYWQIMCNKPRGIWTDESSARITFLAEEIKRLKRPWL